MSSLARHGVKGGNGGLQELYSTIIRGVAFALVSVLCVALSSEEAERGDTANCGACLNSQHAGSRPSAEGTCISTETARTTYFHVKTLRVDRTLW